jgi:hypothetical protein
MPPAAAALVAPAPMIAPALVRCEIEQEMASTPSGSPKMLPAAATVIPPPLLTIGPAVGRLIVCWDGTHSARAAPGAVSAASAMSEAEASSAARAASAGVNRIAGCGPLCSLARLATPPCAHDVLPLDR